MCPVLVMTLSSLICVVQVVSVQGLDVRHAEELIEINAIGTTMKSKYGIFDEDRAVAIKKTTLGSIGRRACVDQSPRRRSGLSCARLAGTVPCEPSNGGKRCGEPGEIDDEGTRSGLWNAYDKDFANFCGATSWAWGTSQDGAKIEPGEAATTCCETCAEAAVNIEFGGNSHMSDKSGALARPEELRAFQCHSADDCQACTSTTNCFHGYGSKGRMDINVAAGASFALYRAVVRTVCPPGDHASWKVTVRYPESARIGPEDGAFENGDVKVYMNEILKRTWTPTSDSGFSSWYGPMTSGPQSLKIDFIPSNSAQASHVNLLMEALQVSASFESCQASKNCLNIFGDGSEVGFALRNSNPDQYRCLLGGSMGNALDAKCEAWKACMLGAQSDLIETADKTAENAAGVIEPEIESENLKATNLEQLQTGAIIATAVEYQFYRMAKNTCCCPVSDRIPSKTECETAMDALGLPRSKPYLGDATSIPGGCSNSKKGYKAGRNDMHWVATEPGEKRNDMFPICRRPLPVTTTTVQKNGPEPSKGQMQIDFLKALMKASGIQPTSSSLVASVAAHNEGRERKLSTVTDVPGCFHPETADAEAWDCECMEQMIEACDGVDESCFASHMCTHADVCGSWKTHNNCGSSLMESMANRSVLNTNANAKASGTVDDALKGKCAV